MTQIPDIRNKRPMGWVGYDATCRVCQSLERRWHPILVRRGFPFVPLQDPDFAARLGVVHGHIHAEMKLLLRDGRILGGADAVRHLARQIWWLAPIAWLGGIPPFRGLVDLLYRWVAANRQCLGDACPVPDIGRQRRHPHTTVFFESP